LGRQILKNNPTHLIELEAKTSCVKNEVFFITLVDRFTILLDAINLPLFQLIIKSEGFHCPGCGF
jgi:hypothetical protein